MAGAFLLCIIIKQLSTGWFCLFNNDLLSFAGYTNELYLCYAN